MKHKNKAQFSILLSTLFAAFLSFGNVFALKPMISISSPNVNIGVGDSAQVTLDTTDFYGDVKVATANGYVATAKLVGCETVSNCTIRNRLITVAVQGVSSGSTKATVTFSGMISSSGIKFTETQNINITVQNSDPSLSSLQVAPVGINFNKDTTEYTVSVEHNVESISISATPVNSSTTVSGTGTFTLKDYMNTFEVVATSQSGAQVSYKINVKRKDDTGRTAASSKKSEKSNSKSSDNTLVDILIPGYEIEFNKDVTEYKITVGPEEGSLMMRAVPASDKAKVEIEGNDSIEIGENLIKITVTAENGQAKDYIIRVTRPESKENGALITGKNSEDGNLDVLGVNANGQGFNALPIILAVAGLFTAAGAVTTVVFLKKRSGAKRKQFNVMRVNNGFRPGSIR